MSLNSWLKNVTSIDPNVIDDVILIISVVVILGLSWLVYVI